MFACLLIHVLGMVYSHVVHNYVIENLTAHYGCTVGIEMSRLTDKHLPVLIRQLRKHAAKWREIGTHLEFLPGELDNIESKQNLSTGAPVSLLGEMLQEWLQWAPCDDRGSVSFAKLRDLKNALCAAGLGASAHDLTITKEGS